MKKEMKKIAAIALSAVCVLSATACGGKGGNGGGQTVDSSKTQLYVCYYNAGFSNRWLTAAAERFEKMYAEYSFEDGKMGVQVIMDPVSNGDMSSIIETKRSEVYFMESYATEKYAPLLADISNAMSVSLGESYGVDKNGKALPGYAGETKSIFEKMTTFEQSYYISKDGQGNNQGFVVPYLDCYNGTITYDMDVFEKHGLYYKADNTLGGKKSTGVALGVGPDGVAGTADDGLPRTYDEFFEICKKMKRQYSTTPFIWAGNYLSYLNQVGRSLFVQNIGSAQLNAMLAGEGTLKDYINGEVASNGTYTVKEETFTADTYKKMYNVAGLYNAINFLYRIAKDQYYNEENCFNGNYSHEVAQADFLFGFENGDCDYGFLIDGTWWYNEAEKYLQAYEQKVDDRDTRNFSYMPLPKADEATWERTKGENVVFTTYLSGYGMKKNISDDKRLLAETFIRFYATDESLIEFNTIVSTPRGLDYTMSQPQYNALSSYGKSLYAIHTGMDGYETYKVCYGVSTGDFFRTNKVLDGLVTSKIGNVEYTNALETFRTNISKGMTAADYFNGVLVKKGVK